VLTRYRFAYVEFLEAEHVDAATALDNSLFRGRLLKVWLRYPCSLPGR
jgi:hypothetical protein